MLSLLNMFTLQLHVLSTALTVVSFFFFWVKKKSVPLKKAACFALRFVVVDYLIGNCFKIHWSWFHQIRNEMFAVGSSI